MTNVIPLSPRLKRNRADAAAMAEQRAALASDLIHLIEQVTEVTQRAASLAGPPIEVERAAQHLLDAVTALERGVDVLTDAGEWVPF